MIGEIKVVIVDQGSHVEFVWVDGTGAKAERLFFMIGLSFRISSVDFMRNTTMLDEKIEVSGC